MIIDQQEEFTRDWDWYAVDQDGHVGHFTTAGFRALPKSVRQDREAAEALSGYFFASGACERRFLYSARSRNRLWRMEEARPRHIPSRLRIHGQQKIVFVRCGSQSRGRLPLLSGSGSHVPAATWRSSVFNPTSPFTHSRATEIRGLSIHSEHGNGELVKEAETRQSVQERAPAKRLEVARAPGRDHICF